MEASLKLHKAVLCSLARGTLRIAIDDAFVTELRRCEICYGARRTIPPLGG
jgi:hypothetical protein